MRSTRFTRTEAELQQAEARLRDRLLVLLPEAAEGGRALFTNSAFNPSKLRASHFAVDAESLLSEARKCLDLRIALGLSTKGSVGQLFLEACGEAAGSDPHRRGPRRLAAALLEAIANAA